MRQIVKQPAERLLLPVTIAGVATIAALGAVEVIARGLVPSGPALTAQPQLFAGAITLILEGGADGERYLVTITATDAAGASAEEEIEVAVIDAAWAVPAGGAAMLSIADFVARVGLDRIVQLTDATGSGRIDSQLIGAALSDAQAEVEAHLGAVVALPLVAIPRIIEVAIADLARERLYPDAAPEAVVAAAKAARKTLERIQSGALPLPGIAPTAAAAPAVDPIIVAGPGLRWGDRITGFDR